VSSFRFEFNEDGMKDLERQLAGQVSAGLTIPLGGTEEDAIASVKEQLVNMGATPNDAEVEGIVREARGQ
jgi:hypothetical protein